MTHPPIEAQKIARLVAELTDELVGLQQIEADAHTAISRLAGREPDRFDLRAVGSILHDFYSGVESLFEKVALVLNGGLPEGERWRAQLLRDMALDLERVRPPVISASLRQRLDEYRRFRHVFRHIYGHMLTWERMEPLLSGLPDVVAALYKEISSFLIFLRDLARQLEDT